MFCCQCNDNTIAIQCFQCCRYFCCGNFSKGKCGFDIDYDWLEPVCKYCENDLEFCVNCKTQVKKMPCKYCIKYKNFRK